MASSADIQAGRAAIQVVLDDQALQPQLQQLSGRLKAAAAGAIVADGSKNAAKFKAAELRKGYQDLAKDAAGVGASHLGAIPGVSGLQSVLSAGHPVLIAVAAATAGIAAAYKLARVAADWYTSSVKEQLGEIDALSAKAQALGTTVQALREWHAAAKEVGEVEAGDFDDALQKLTRRIGEAATGSAEAGKAFGDLGLDSTELANQVPTEAFLQVAEAISKIENPAQRAAAANDVFGRGSAKLIPLLQGGREGIEAATAAYREYAGVLSEDQVAAIGAQDEAWGRVHATLEGIAAQAAADLAPALQVAAERVSEILDPKTAGGQSLLTSLELIPPVLTRIIDLSDILVGGFQAGATSIKGMVNAAVQAAAMLDRMLAAATPGYEGNADLQAMAGEWSKDLGESADEAVGRIYRGATMQASADVAKAQQDAAAGTQSGKTAGEVGQLANADDAGGSGGKTAAELDAEWEAETERQYNETMSREADRRRQERADAEKALTEQASEYADMFAAAMEGRAESNKAARDAAPTLEQTAGYAADFASAMEAAGDASKSAIEAERAGGNVNEFDAGLMLEGRIAELQQRKAADEIERRARAAVEGPQLTSAGTMSGYRLAGQFGQQSRPQEQLLAESKKQTRALERLNDTLDRKQTVYP